MAYTTLLIGALQTLAVESPLHHFLGVPFSAKASDVSAPVPENFLTPPRSDFRRAPTPELMATTAQQRRQTRISAAATECVTALKDICEDTTLSDMRGLYERAVALSEAAESGAAYTATRLLTNCGVMPHTKIETDAACKSLIVRLKAASATGAGFAHAAPNEAVASSHTLVVAFIGLLRSRAAIETDLIAGAGVPTPTTALRATGTAGATPGSGVVSNGLGARAQTISINTEAEKKVARISQLGAWLAKHQPGLVFRHLNTMPHSDLVLKFMPWVNADTPLRLPLWKDIKERLHQVDVRPGRASGVNQTVTALVGMLNAYAGPMPDGYVRSATDVLDLEYDLEVTDPATNAVVKKTEKRPPILSAATVNAAIADVYATAEPLSLEQKESYSETYWTELQGKLNEQGQEKKSLTRALTALLESQTLVPWRKLVRGELCPGTALSEALLSSTPRRDARRDDYRRDDRPRDRDPRDRDDRSYDRSRDRDRDDRPRDEDRGRDGGRKSKPSKEERQARPTCEAWRATGRCSALGKGCKKRHPTEWTNLGETKARAQQ